jgi:peroxiredoxin
MKKYFMVLAGVLAVFFALSCIQTEKPLAQSAAKNFTLRDLDNAEHSLSSCIGKKNIILFFWTTWCPYCRREILVLNDMYMELAKNNFEVISINVGESAYKVDDFFKRNKKADFVVLLDENTSVSEDYDIFGIPTFVLIDKQGNQISKGNQFPRTEYNRLISKNP